MTVGELILALEEAPPLAPVYIVASGASTHAIAGTHCLRYRLAGDAASGTRYEFRIDVGGARC